MTQRTSLLLLFSLGSALAQGIPKHAEKSELSTYFLPPTRNVWTSKKGVENADYLRKPAPGQAALNEVHSPVALTTGEDSGAIVLDFGAEIAGYLERFCPGTNIKAPKKARIRFGESVAETMVDIGKRVTQNDHALRDQIIELPWLGKKIVGPPASAIKSVYLLGDASRTPLKITRKRDHVAIKLLAAAPDPIATVLCIDLETPG